MTILLAIATSILSMLSFPSVGWWPLIFVAQLPLMASLENQKSLSRIFLGGLSGTLFIIASQLWLISTLIERHGLTWPVATALFIGYSLAMGFQWAVFAWIYAPLRQKSGRAWVLTVPLLYALIEHTYPCVYPLPFASALYELPVLLQSSIWLGASGPTWMIMFVTCALLQTAEDLTRNRATEHLAITGAAAVWFIVSFTGVATMRESWNAPQSNRLTVALIQANSSHEDVTSENPIRRETAFEKLAAMTKEAMALRPNVIVWPENAFPFKFEADVVHDLSSPRSLDLRYSRRIYKLALSLGVDIVFGSQRYVDGALRNSAIHLTSGGAQSHVYDQQVLSLLSNSGLSSETSRPLDSETLKYQPGQTFTSLRIADSQWTPLLGGEASIPSLVREGLGQHHQNNFLLALSSDLGSSSAAAAQQQMMVEVQRAIENRIWLVRVTNTGISALVDPTGTIRAQTELGEERVLAAEIQQPALNPSFYRQHGDFWLYFAVGAALIGLIIRNRRDFGNNLNTRVVSDKGLENVDTIK